MEDLEHLVQTKDFESLAVSVSLTNLTSADQRVITASFEELSDEGCVIGCPTHTAAHGHTVLLAVLFPGGQLKATAKVIDCADPSEKGTDQLARLALSLVQYEKTEFEALKALYANRQEEISALMTAIKGY